MNASAAVKTIPLSKTTKFIVDNRGRTAPTEKTGIPLIATNCISNNQLYPSYEKLRYVSESTYDTWFRSHPLPGDIIITNKGSQNGAICLVPDPVDFVIAQDMVALRADEEVIDPLFLFAALRSPGVQRQIKDLDVSGVIPHLKKTDFDKLHLPYPDRNMQEIIGKTYFDFCRLIELNRQMNATLEMIVGTLFKSWFVDFDPVKRNAGDGNRREDDAFFPHLLVDSPIGFIPQGWHVGSIYEIANVIYGAPFASKQFNSIGNGRPLIRIRDLKNEAPGVWTPEDHPKGYVVQAGDIVVGMDGEFRAYLWGGEEAWLNQRVCVFEPKSQFSAAFVRNSIIAPLAKIEASETATTVIHLGKNDIDEFKVVVPSPAVNEAFDRRSRPLYQRIVANKQQTRTLVALRDALLPKMLSGKFTLPSCNP